MTDYNAFTGGIEPGGLRTKNDIRILICYILHSVHAPLSGEDLSGILQKKSLANYFEIQDALSSLLKNGNILKNESGEYQIGPGGKEIAEHLDDTLPLSVRDKALDAAMKMLARAKNEREHKVDILEDEDGHRVICHISGGDREMMSVSLSVPDILQAQIVKDNFHENPGGIYEVVLAALTNDKELGRKYFD
jgi:hypothetical protein